MNQAIPKEISISHIDINLLNPAPYNPRQASEEEYHQLKESIEKFGLIDPLLVNAAPGRKNVVIGGHFRLKIAKDIGLKTVPVVYINIPDIEKEKELNLRLNRNTGSWNFDELANFDEDVLKDIGFDSKELDNIFQLDTAPEDDVVPENAPPVAKTGDIWLLGRHRVMCGDSTKREDVEKLMDGKKADMVFTDPPYGIDVVSNSPRLQEKKKLGSIGGSVLAKIGHYSSVIGDNTTITARKSIEILKNYSENFIIWGGNYFTDFLLPSRGWIVWDKRNGDTTFADAELAWTSFNKSVRLYQFLWSGMRREGNRAEEGKLRFHPTQKPVGLLTEIINDWCKEDLIIDIFLGSGSTLIACEKTNRICYGMEIDAKYCDVIIKRWEEHTGKKAQCIN